MLKVEAGTVTLQTTTREVVEFFTRHGVTGEMEELAVGLFDQSVRCMKRYEEAEGQKRETSALLEGLRAMEARQQEAVAEAARSAVAALTARTSEAADRVERVTREVGHAVTAEVGASASKLAASIDGVDGRVQTQMCGLVTAVDGAVRSSIAQLDADALASRVSDAVKGWLMAEVGQVKEGQASARAALEGMEAGLRSELSRTVSEPMRMHGEHMATMLGALPSQVASLCTASRDRYEQGVDSKLADLRQKLGAAGEQHRREASEMKEVLQSCSTKVAKVLSEVGRAAADSKERSADAKAAMVRNADQVPKVVKGVVGEALRSLETQQATVRASVSGAMAELLKLERDMAENRSSMTVLRKVSDDAVAKLEGLAQQLTASQTRKAHSHTVKGQEGESRLYDLLSERLMSRDGYEVERVGGIAHQADMAIKRLNHPDVRIESKAHGQGTGEKCRHREVVKFQNDLMGLNTHGIFVSLHSGIVGKTDIEVELLANNKFAVYLANNNYNTDVICDMLQLIYRLDMIISRGDGDGKESEPGIRVSQEAMKRVTAYCKDFASKVAAAKQHMRESIALLTELNMDVIERVLMGQQAVAKQAVAKQAVAAPAAVPAPQPAPEAEPVPQPAAAPVPAPAVFMCETCGFVCRTAAALGSHARKHAPGRGVGVRAA
jgi:hypothetical protein